MKTDRLAKLKFLTIGVVVMAGLSLFGRQSPALTGVLCVLCCALEIIRLELRDIREELQKGTRESE